MLLIAQYHSRTTKPQPTKKWLWVVLLYRAVIERFERSMIATQYHLNGLTDFDDFCTKLISYVPCIAEQ